MTNGRHDFALPDGLAHEIDHRLRAAHMVGGIAPGDNHRVEIRCADAIRTRISLRRIAVLRGVAGGTAPHYGDLSSGLAQTEQRVPELEILVEILDQYGYALVCEFHGQTLPHTSLCAIPAVDSCGRTGHFAGLLTVMSFRVLAR